MEIYIDQDPEEWINRKCHYWPILDGLCPFFPQFSIVPSTAGTPPFQLTQKCFIFGNNLCYFQSKLPMRPSYSPSFPLNRHKFLQLFAIFLFIIPSFSSSTSTENQQELAKIAECVYRKPKDKPFICDPHGILSPMERHKIRHLLMDRFLDKIGKNEDKNVCQ
jgi:hypothetical protein